MDDFFAGARGVFDVVEAVAPTVQELTPGFVVGALAAITVITEAAFPAADMNQLLEVAKKLGEEELKV
jgi:hypothetical protein